MTLKIMQMALLDFQMSWLFFKSVTSECTALLGQKSGFRGVLDSSFSLCTVPTYYCRSKYFLVSIHKFRLNQN